MLHSFKALLSIYPGMTENERVLALTRKVKEK